MPLIHRPAISLPLAALAGVDRSSGIFNSIGPVLPGTGRAPSDTARLKAAAASLTRKAMAQALGPCTRAKAWLKLSGSALMMKFTSPWR